MGVVLAIFGIAGLIWGLVLVRRGGLLSLCLAELLVAACLGYQFFHLAASPMPITADRVLMVALCGVYGIYRLMGWADPKPLDGADLATLLFVAVLTLNTFAHDWTYNQRQPLSDLVFYCYQPLVLYWVARQSALGERELRLFRAVLACLGLYLAFTALAEMHDVRSLIFPKYIVATSATEWLGRARGPFLSPPTNGLFLGTSLAVWTMYCAGANRLVRLPVLGGMGTILVGVYYTLTRACWMGSLLGVWVVLFFVLPRRWRLSFAACSLLLTAVALPLASRGLVAFKREKYLSAEETARSASLRPIIAAVEWRIFLDHPLFGCGYGNYPKVSKAYLRDPESELPLERARGFVHHNMFLAVLTDTGLTGLASYLAMLGWWSLHAWRLWSDSRLSMAARQHGLFWFAYLANFVTLGMFHNVNADLSIAQLTFLSAGIVQGSFAAARRSLAPRLVDAAVPARGIAEWLGRQAHAGTGLEPGPRLANPA